MRPALRILGLALLLLAISACVDVQYSDVLDELVPGGSGRFENAIISHNDDAGWSRAKIAQWLRRVAAKL